MSHGKQFTLFSHAGGPNPWKVAILFEELGLTYETVYLDFQKGEHKQPGYTKYNPNGRVPAIIDHSNNDFVLWESDAILQYVVDKYDKEHKLTVTNENDKYRLLQWLFFQSSGQGPYFGQAAWFLNYHPEKLPSAIERYQKEILRVFGVLESVLAKQEWLVGGKYTIADLSFVTWNAVGINFAVKDYQGFNFEKEFPAVYAWNARINARPAVKKAFEIKASLQK